MATKPRSSARGPKRTNDDAAPRIVAEGIDLHTKEVFLLVGGRDRDGKPCEALISQEDVLLGEVAVCKTLQLAGFSIPLTRRGKSKLVEALEQQRDDPEQRKARRRVIVASQVGWLDLGEPGAERLVFVHPMGVIGKAKAEVRVRLDPDYPIDKFVPSGKLPDWQGRVLPLACGNHAAMFAICLAFASPLVHPLNEQNCGFQLVGTSGMGKSISARFGASVWGGSEFEEKWLTTINSLDPTAVGHNDMFLVLDETGLTKGKNRSEDRMLLDAPYRLGEGKTKRRLTDAAPLRKYRLCYLSTSERTLAQIAAAVSEPLAAGQSARLIDLLLSSTIDEGIFQDLHGEPDLEAFCERVAWETKEACGTAGLAFLEGLVGLLDEDAEGLRRWLKRRMKAYRKKAKSLAPSLAAKRAARHFALVYAAGCLAARLGIIDWQRSEIMAAVLYCHRHMGELPAATERAEAVDPLRGCIAVARKRIARHRPDFLDLGQEAPASKVKAAPGFVHHRKNGEEQLLFTPAKFREVVYAGGDDRAMLAALKAEGLLVMHRGGKSSIPRELPDPLGRRRVVCLRGAIAKGMGDGRKSG